MLQGGEPPCFRHDLWSLSQPARGYVESVVTLDLVINPNFVALTQKGRDLIARGFREVVSSPSALHELHEYGGTMAISGPVGPLSVFLCHASVNKDRVRALYARLRADGVRPWLDEEDLLPGQEWEDEIPRAVRESDIVLVCLSNQSVTRTGYVQREIRFALDAAEERPPGTIYVIPARLEECEVPDLLRRWQRVDLFAERGYERLMQALRLHAARLVANQASSRSPDVLRDAPVAAPVPAAPDVSGDASDQPSMQHLPTGLTGAGDATASGLAALPSQAEIQRNIGLFAQAQSFRGAEDLARDLILPLAPNLSADQVRDILTAVEGTNQIWDASKMPTLLLRLFHTTSQHLPETHGAWSALLGFLERQGVEQRYIALAQQLALADARSRRGDT